MGSAAHRGSKPVNPLASLPLKRRGKDHRASLRVTCAQNVEAPTLCWLSRLKLPVQISSYQTSSRCGLAPIPYAGRKLLPHQGSNEFSIPKYYLNCEATRCGWNLKKTIVAWAVDLISIVWKTVRKMLIGNSWGRRKVGRYTRRQPDVRERSLQALRERERERESVCVTNEAKGSVQIEWGLYHRGGKYLTWTLAPCSSNSYCIGSYTGLLSRAGNFINKLPN